MSGDDVVARTRRVLVHIEVVLIALLLVTGIDLGLIIVLVGGAC